MGRSELLCTTFFAEIKLLIVCCSIDCAVFQLTARSGLYERLSELMKMQFGNDDVVAHYYTRRIKILNRCLLSSKDAWSTKKKKKAEAHNRTFGPCVHGYKKSKA